MLEFGLYKGVDMYLKKVGILILIVSCYGFGSAGILWECVLVII
jgi:hypothetical protein